MGLRRHALHEKVELRIIDQPTDEVLEQLFRVEVSAHSDPWTYDGIKECFATNTRCIGLFLKNKIVGFAIVCVIYEDSELFTIGIERKYQGLGFGHKLLQKSLEVCLELGAQKCFLEVRVSNEVAIHLYDRYGFQITGTRKRYYPATATTPVEDAFTMACDLTKLDEIIGGIDSSATDPAADTSSEITPQA